MQKFKLIQGGISCVSHYISQGGISYVSHYISHYITQGGISCVSQDSNSPSEESIAT